MLKEDKQKLQEHTFTACLNPLSLSVFGKIPQGVILIDSHGTVIYANDKLKDLLGYAPLELIGLAHEEVTVLLLGKYHKYIDIKQDWINLSKGNNLVNRRKFTHKNGQTVPLEVQAYPILDNENNFNGEVLFLKDLHEELITTVTKFVNSTLSLDEVLDNTTKAVTGHLGLASNTIFLLNEEENILRLATCTVFPSQDEVKKVAFKVGQGVPGIVAAQRKPKYVKNLRVSPKVSEQARKYHGDESCIAFPLICKDELLGVISFNADTVRTFTNKEMTLFENITKQVALAIYNAQLFYKLQHLSITDGLTGIYNHRYLQERLKEEVQRAERSGEQLSLLMIDVDNFKNYNDIFGHVYGDEVLKQTAILLQQNVRNFDVVARYGGEEFSVILVNCGKDEALKIASRIRNAIEEFPFYGAEYQPKGKVTVSIGLAINNELFNNKQLLFYADKALYKAKKEGRNRVEVLAG